LCVYEFIGGSIPDKQKMIQPPPACMGVQAGRNNGVVVLRASLWLQDVLGDALDIRPARVEIAPNHYSAAKAVAESPLAIENEPDRVCVQAIYRC
jgi:hypothetical protein